MTVSAMERTKARKGTRIVRSRTLFLGGRKGLYLPEGMWAKTRRQWGRRLCRDLRDCIPSGQNIKSLRPRSVPGVRDSIGKGKQRRGRLCRALFYGTVFDFFLWKRWGIPGESLVKACGYMTCFNIFSLAAIQQTEEQGKKEVGRFIKRLMH